MKASTMTLTPQDLSAISTLLDDRIETKVRPMVHEIVNEAVGGAIDKLSLEIAEGFNEVSERFDLVESDITELKTDVTELKLDMREVKWGQADTVRRSEFLDVRERVARLEHPS